VIASNIAHYSGLLGHITSDAYPCFWSQISYPLAGRLYAIHHFLPRFSMR